MKSATRKLIVGIVLLGAMGSLGWAILQRFQEHSAPAKRSGGPRPAPVEVALIEHGPIQLRRTFSGTLEARAEFVVAPKISGRIIRLDVDLADTVERGQVVAWLDDDEHVQNVAQAEAVLAVARANRSEAQSALQTISRERQRVEQLRARGITSEAQFEVVTANYLTQQAQLNVARAQVAQAEAALESARIRLGYTQVLADWNGGDEQRVVAERFVDEGETVAANAPLLAIVELSPMIGVIFVTERDYTRMQPGQPASLTTDAYPGEVFQGQISRIAPVFQQATRQARVELRIENAEQRLKPGMFIRATVVLERALNATIVPQQALTTRDERTGVFLVNQHGRSVVWREVTVGIRDGDRVQVQGADLRGQVVTLGQQLVDDGSPITLPAEQHPREAISVQEDGT